MTTLLVGTNRFENCETLLAHRGVPVLRVEATSAGLVLDLQTPQDAKPLRIERNVVTDGDASVICAARLVTVVANGTPLLHAAQLLEHEVLVDLDFRPLGMAIYSDATGLHIGGSTLAGNTVKGARVAISLS